MDLTVRLHRLGSAIKDNPGIVLLAAVILFAICLFGAVYCDAFLKRRRKQARQRRRHHRTRS